MMQSHKFGVLWVLAILAHCPARGGAGPIQFNRDIHPILSENCFACHGPDKNQRKAKLRLDVREVALEKGALVPGNPGQSKLVERIFSQDPDEMMPPPKAHKTLTATQKELLKNWIAAGAAYQSHWAYINPQRPPVPTTHDSRWVRNPIDAFILSELEAGRISPSPEADKATLLRRLSLDLIGLPPTPEQAKDFIHDRRTDAYERAVDHLLSSPHFGERMAVPWFDVVRFTDTVGYHGDQNLNDFPYRDYVINAFNRNKPFDQFTLEQIAGDLLPQPSVEARVATGFNRLNMVTREGGAQDKEYLAKYAADRVRTVSMAWLGSTMGCAECHDHKFDPFTSKDFYRMEAFFADIKQWGVYEDYDYTPNPDLRGIDNDSPFPPEMDVVSPYLQKRIEQLRAQVTTFVEQQARRYRDDPAAREALSQWRIGSIQFLNQSSSGWFIPNPEVFLEMKDTNAVPGTNFAVKSDATVAFSNLPKARIKLTLPLINMGLAAIRLEVQTHQDNPESKQNRRGNSLALTATLKRNGDQAQKLNFYDAEANHKEERYANGAAIIGIKDRWKLSADNQSQFGIWVLDEPMAVAAGDSLVIDLGGPAVEAVRVSVTPFAALEPLDSGHGPSDLTARRRQNSPPSAPYLATFLLSQSFDVSARKLMRELAREIRACRNGHASTVVTEVREPRVTRILARGDWQNESGEIVVPGVPHFLPQIANSDNRQLTRLDLANWLVSPENPLTARVIMNRLWKQLFGVGLSVGVDDLGAQGEWPVHPELLDWLACEFRQPTPPAYSRAGIESPHTWDIKHMAKLMVMSSTYRQQSNPRPDLKDVDPNNRLLACQSPRRLEAEFVRDNALFIAGILNQDIGGPSFHPYQPGGYYANLQFPDRDYYPERDERQFRRGVYAHWQRTFLQPMLANFDAPSREECTANRNQSNTPQQALTLLNDPTFNEAARIFAARLLASRQPKDERLLNLAFDYALARAPGKREQESLLTFLAVQREHYQTSAEDSKKVTQIGIAPIPEKPQPSELAAWTQVCRVILNLHETTTRY